jgi:hypothetical protein
MSGGRKGTGRSVSAESKTEMTTRRAQRSAGVPREVDEARGHEAAGVTGRASAGAWLSGCWATVRWEARAWQRTAVIGRLGTSRVIDERRR